jgi:hypothetical protein
MDNDYRKHVQILNCSQRVDERFINDPKYMNDYLKADMARALGRAIIESGVHKELPMRRNDFHGMHEVVWHVAVVDQEKTKLFSDQLVLAEEVGRQKCIGTICEAIKKEGETRSQTAGIYRTNTEFLAGMRYALEKVRSLEIK